MTPADRLARLEEEVAFLRRELGDMVTANQVHALRAAIGMEPQQARLVLRLYHAGGRIVPLQQLASVLGENTDAGALKVHFSRLRRRFGCDWVENAYALGYRLTPAGTAVVARALCEQLVRAA